MTRLSSDPRLERTRRRVAIFDALLICAAVLAACELYGISPAQVWRWVAGMIGG